MKNISQNSTKKDFFFKTFIFLIALNIYPIISKGQWTKIEDVSFPAFNTIRCLVNDQNGNLYAAGDFNYVAKWNGSNWSKLGGPIDPFNNVVYSLAIDKNNNIYAAGAFTNVNGVNYVAKWNGNSWSALGQLNGSKYFNGGITNIVTDLNGQLFATGLLFKGNGFFVAKWIGSSWSFLGDTTKSIFNFPIKSLAINPNGDIFAAGAFTKSTNLGSLYYVAKWNGSSWVMEGNTDTSFMQDPFSSIIFDTRGNLITANGISSHSKINKWDGLKWIKLGATLQLGQLTDEIQLTSDESNNIYAVGNLSKKIGPFDYSYVLRWAGNIWNELGGNNSLQLFTRINSISFDNNGSLYIGGNEIFKQTSNVAKIIIAPTITSFYPTSAVKGTIVTIIGSNFKGVKSVYFGNDSAISFNKINDSTITAIVGQGSSGSVSVTNLGGSTSLPGFNFIATGLTELKLLEIKIFPNPAQEILEINSDICLDNKEYKIYDCLGKLIMRGKLINQRKIISICELESGVYNLIISDFDWKSYKFVKE